MTPTLTALERIALRFRNAPVALASTAVAASIAAHTAFTIALPDRVSQASRPEPAPTELEFVELPALPPPTRAPEPETPAPVGVGTDEQHEGGLRVARGRPLPALVLSHAGPSGPFAVRDRLSLGDLTPRTVARRTTPTPRGDSNPAQVDSAAVLTPDPATNPTSPTELAVTAAPEPEAIVPDRTSITEIAIAVDLERFAESGAASRLDDSASRFDGSDAFAILGLEPGEVRRASRLFRAGDRTTAIAITSALAAAELRTRIEGAFNARNQMVRFDGDPERAIARTFLGERAIVVANDGSSIALADAADEAGLDALLAALAPGELVHVRMSGTRGPETSWRVDATLSDRDGIAELRVRTKVEGADTTVEPTAEMIARACISIRVDADAFELAAPAVWEGDEAVFTLRLGSDDVDTVARRLASLR